jgi:hypothetical protein
LLGVHAGGESVERIGFDHFQLRRRKAARNAKIFQDGVEPRVVAALNFAAAGDSIDHALMKIVGDHDPGRGADGRERRRLEEIDPGDLHQRVEIGVQ